MKLGKTLYVTNRRDWRAWLKRHHATEGEIWLIYYRKDTGKPRIPYDDAVEEALCYGWIDSTVKKLDENRFAQRFSPRRPTSNLSEMNKERIRRLIAQKKMTQAGLSAIRHVFAPESAKTPTKFTIAPDIQNALRNDAQAWKNFQKFPASYKRIRIGWIEGARNRPQEFEKRLSYFLKMTHQNKRFGAEVPIVKGSGTVRARRRSVAK
jgi:uncharacterized protein YdeI (YjbR/CyaY-like superfamily)